MRRMPTPPPMMRAGQVAGATPVAQSGVAEASEGPGVEDGAVVAAGDGEWWASGRKGRDVYARWECHRVFLF
jgi:hypothetical protein